jgi:hypothetical protein
MNRSPRRLNGINKGDPNEASPWIYTVMNNREVTSRKGEDARFLRELERELLIARVEL